MSEEAKVYCGCGSEIPAARVNALKDMMPISDMLCIECAQANPAKRIEADFRYDGGSNGGERPRHW